ncbi:MAG: DUF4375 domain-containing protein [Phycisphaerales bacterium]|nr:DUF4375 domain-containing protein [Phycisphaerales bacterium]
MKQVIRVCEDGIWHYKLPKTKSEALDLRIERSAYNSAKDKCAAVVAGAIAHIWQQETNIMERLIQSTEMRLYQLSRGLQVMVPIVQMLDDIEAGGFLRYFRGDNCWFVFKAVEGLKELGAGEQAKVLKRAMQAFPNAKVPRRYERRLAMLQGCEVRQLKPLMGLDLHPLRGDSERCDPKILARFRKCDVDWLNADRGKAAIRSRLGPRFIEAHLDDFVRSIVSRQTENQEFGTQ